MIKHLDTAANHRCLRVLMSYQRPGPVSGPWPLSLEEQGVEDDKEREQKQAARAAGAPGHGRMAPTAATIVPFPRYDVGQPLDELPEVPPRMRPTVQRFPPDQVHALIAWRPAQGTQTPPKPKSVPVHFMQQLPVTKDHHGACD